MRVLLVAVVLSVCAICACAADVAGVDTTSLYLQALMHEEGRDYAAAGKLYRKILSVDKSPTLYLKLSNTELATVADNVSEENILRAIDVLQQGYENFPANEDIVFRLGYLYHELGKGSAENKADYFNSAKKMFLEAVSISESEQNLVALAALASDMGDYPLALSTYDTLINKHGLNEYLYSRGEMKIAHGDKAGGMQDLNSAADNDNIKALLELAQLALDDNDVAAAEGYLLRVSELNDGLVLPEMYLGELYSRNGNPEKAIEYYIIAAEHATGEMRANILKEAGWLAVNMKDYDKAAGLLDGALANGSEDSQLYYLAAYTQSMINPQKAAQVYEDAIKKFPDYAVLRKHAAVNYLTLDEPKKAVDVLTKIAAVEQDVEYYLILAESYTALEELDKAIATYKKGIDENRYTLDLYLGLAGLYSYNGMDAEVIPLLEGAIQLLPESPELQNFLGYYYAYLNIKLDEGEALIDKALAQEPNNYAYIDSKAWVLYRKGDYKNAMRYIKEAIALAPEDEEVLEHYQEIEKFQ